MTSARGLVRLLRPPNVWTALADSAAGMLVVGVWAPSLLGASACLYLAGIVLNDLFDRDVDARERPGRPIPAGEVDAGVAAALGVGLLAGGAALGFVAGRVTGTIALAVAVAVLLYDGGLKRTAVGPLVMGSCRALNFLLGIAAAGAVPAWPEARLAGPASLGLYIAALTFVARDEVIGNGRVRARLGLAALTALAATAVALLAQATAPWSAWAWLAALLLLELRNWAPLWHDASAPRTGRAIGGAILLIPVLDATVVAVAGRPLHAAGVAALMLPAIILRRWYSPT